MESGEVVGDEVVEKVVVELAAKDVESGANSGDCVTIAARGAGANGIRDGPLESVGVEQVEVIVENVRLFNLGVAAKDDKGVAERESRVADAGARATLSFK